MTEVKYKSPYVTVYMPDGKTIQVKRISPLANPGLSDFKQLYQQMVALLVKHNASMGDILTDPEGLKCLLDMAEMLPTGEGSKGLDVSALIEAGDIEQVCTLFVTASMQRDGKNMGKYKTGPKGENLAYEPSDLAQLHQLDFFGYVQTALENNKQTADLIKAKIEQETAKVLNGYSENPLVVETQT